jgi:hypothetical protein
MNSLKNLVEQLEFCENWLSEIHILLNGVDEFWIEFDWSDLRVTIISSFEFIENCCRQVCTVRKRSTWSSFRIFYTSCPWTELGAGDVHKNLTGFLWISRNRAYLKATLYLGTYMNLYSYFPPFCPIWVKFDTGHRHVMLLISYEFLQNQRRKDCAFRIGINEKYLSV